MGASWPRFARLAMRRRTSSTRCSAIGRLQRWYAVRTYYSAGAACRAPVVSGPRSLGPRSDADQIERVIVGIRQSLIDGATAHRNPLRITYLHVASAADGCGVQVLDAKWDWMMAGQRPASSWRRTGCWLRLPPR